MTVTAATPSRCTLRRNPGSASGRYGSDLHCNACNAESVPDTESWLEAPMSDVERLLVGALLTVTICAFYAWHIRRHPWVPCGRCHGSSKARHLGLRPFGDCGRCAGKGKRLRFAAWVLGYDLDSGRK